MSETKEDKPLAFIEGDLISLCPSNLDHIELYTKWMNNPQLRKYARYYFPQTIEEVKKLFEPKTEPVKSEIFFEIWHKEDDKPVGFVGFIRINWLTRSARIFYLIGDMNYWGQNIATEAAKLVINYGFTELNLHKIVAQSFGPNKASIRIAEKLGFKLEITLQKERYVDGEYVDLLEHSIFKDDWNRT